MATELNIETKTLDTNTKGIRQANGKDERRHRDFHFNFNFIVFLFMNCAHAQSIKRTVV